VITKLVKKHGSKKISLAVNDALCTLISAYLALYLTIGGALLNPDDFAKFAEKIGIFIIGSLLIIPIFRYYQLYKHKYFLSIGEQTLLLLKGVIIDCIIIILLIFLVRTQETLHESRTQVILYSIISTSLLFITRIFIFRTLLRSKYLGTNLNKFLSRRAIAIGAGGLGKFFAESIEIKHHYHIDLVGFLDDDESKTGTKVGNYRVFGVTKDLEKITTAKQIDEIYVTIQKIQHTALLDLIERCKLTNCQVNLVSNHFEIINVKWDANEFHDLKVIPISSRTSPLYSEKFKRIFDISASLFLIGVVSIPSIFIALLIKATSRGPVFFKTKVIGKDGKEFYWFKFRTMHDKSDPSVHEEHLKEIIRENHANQKIINDLRVTSVGKMLRKFSIDELPQLLNVFKGDMSLVGPRPCLPYEYEIFKDWHKLRTKVIPGMTGLAQIIARNRRDVTFNDSVLLDLYYADNQSLWLDLRILFKTIPVVVMGKGGG
jgi:exopolysaccharide biosynthesis polyprenyl glycosylphosphotransferase